MLQTPAAGQRKREADAKRSREISVGAREIGKPPAVANPVRRAAAEASLEIFCLTYLPAIFYLTWSADHKRVIAKMEKAAREGGLFAVAMPRGSGKTSLAIACVLWVLLYNFRSFIVLIAATDAKAEQLLGVIKSLLLKNDLLAADFPEVCHAIRATEGDARRCGGQLIDGQRTNIKWQSGMIVIPTVEGSKVSGHVIGVAGLTSAIRGMIYTSPDGRILRPDFVIPDDCQTTESAWSDSQCEKREALIAGDVLGMAGPDRKIAAVSPCTIIRHGDLASRLLDRKLHPEWQGEITKMVYTWPTDGKLWEQYTSMRSESLQRGDDGTDATDFYRANRDAMDAGAVVAWPARFNADEISALQHAQNLRMRDELAFMAEYQNAPRQAEQDVAALKPEQIASKCNGLARGTAPLETVAVTSFIDVMDSLLYFAVTAWQPDGTGAILDYGTYPEQPRRYFAMREATATLQKLSPAAGKEGAILSGLQTLITDLFARKFARTDGAELHINKMLIDLGYVPATVETAIRTAAKGALLMGSRGVGIGASGKPMSEYVRKPGELIGREWMVPKPTGTELRSIRFDSNYWKSWIADRLGAPTGDKTSLTLYGTKPAEHRLISDHLTAEIGTPTEGRGRKLREWRPRPNRPDNHFLDCVVGCAVAASMLGIANTNQVKRKPIQRSNRTAQYF